MFHVIRSVGKSWGEQFAFMLLILILILPLDLDLVWAIQFQDNAKSNPSPPAVHQ